ncbi:hypothetical protein CHCC20335_4167 [Bacillus paralicheniformis]|nr:hypothetical protein CHCC20335_4167 [Bacillus paralicheniformis]
MKAHTDLPGQTDRFFLKIAVVPHLTDHLINITFLPFLHETAGWRRIFYEYGEFQIIHP